MALISVSDFFSVGLCAILSLLGFVILLPVFIAGGNILYTMLFSVFDFLIYLPKGLEKAIDVFKKDWKSIYLLVWIKKYKQWKVNKK